MSTSKPRPAAVKPSSELTSELDALEQRVNDLLTNLAQLRDENRALKQAHESLAHERATLLNRHEQVRGQVEAMIGRMKNLEHHYL
jgi:uncharacterized protein (TIGR02449 family)